MTVHERRLRALLRRIYAEIDARCERAEASFVQDAAATRRWLSAKQGWGTRRHNAAVARKAAP